MTKICSNSLGVAGPLYAILTGRLSMYGRSFPVLAAPV